jgi:hypothetical protein
MIYITGICATCEYQCECPNAKEANDVTCQYKKEIKED